MTPTVAIKCIFSKFSCYVLLCTDPESDMSIGKAIDEYHLWLVSGIVIHMQAAIMPEILLFASIRILFFTAVQCCRQSAKPLFVYTYVPHSKWSQWMSNWLSDTIENQSCLTYNEKLEIVWIAQKIKYKQHKSSVDGMEYVVLWWSHSPFVGCHDEML